MSDLKDFLLGRAIAFCSGLRIPTRTPVAYLYNGVRLPALPEWDREAYPFAYVCLDKYSPKYTLMISTQRLEYRSWADRGTLYYTYPVDSPLIEALTFHHAYLTEEELEDGEWDFTWSKTYEAGFDIVQSQAGFGVPFWSNTDVKNHEDGSVYLEATVPVPVYE